MNLKNKIVVITGASDGIGREIAIKLAREGAKLALIARNNEKLKGVAGECIKEGSSDVRSYPCDLRNSDEIKKVVSELISDFGEVNILINNAGIWQKTGELEEASLENIDDVINTNLTGLVKMTNLILPTLRKSQDAAIINVSSHSGIEAKQGQSVYCASKWGVAGFTEALRLDLGGSSNVRIAGLYQGGTHTNLFEKAGDPKDPELFGKFTEPSDLADVVVFMLSRPPKIWLHDVRVEY